MLAMGAWLVLEGRMDRPDLPLAALLALSTFSPVSDLARTGKDLMETLAAGRRVFAVHDEPMSVQDGPGVAAPGEVAVPTAPLVRFDGTSFAYGPGLPQAVSDLSFTIEPGQTVALVGRSGAGKSTCAYLLMRFWDPQSGEVSLGNHNLKEFRLDPLRDSIAFVTQDTYLFNASIGDNIALGKFGASQEEIEEAAQPGKRPRLHILFPRRLRHHGRRARNATLRRSAAAHLHRPSPPQERSQSSFSTKPPPTSTPSASTRCVRPSTA